MRGSTAAAVSRWSGCAAPANRRWVAGLPMRSAIPLSSSTGWSNRTTARAFPISSRWRASQLFALEASALVAAKSCDARHLDEIGNARAVVLFDQPVELDKGIAERIGKPATQRRFAGAAQPDQRDTAATVDPRIPPRAAFDQFGERGKLGARRAREDIRYLGHRRAAPVAAREQFDDRNIERVRDRCEHDHGRVAHSALDLREIALGGAGGVRELAAPTGRWRRRTRGDPRAPARLQAASRSFSP